MLDTCCCEMASGRVVQSWCTRHCEVSGSHLLCFDHPRRRQSDTAGGRRTDAKFKLPLRGTTLYFGDQAFTFIHSGKHYGFRVCHCIVILLGTSLLCPHPLGWRH